MEYIKAIREQHEKHDRYGKGSVELKDKKPLSVKERKKYQIELDAICLQQPPLCIGINHKCECSACESVLFQKKGTKIKWADIKKFNNPITGGFKFIDSELPKWVGTGRVWLQNTLKDQCDIMEAMTRKWCEQWWANEYLRRDIQRQKDINAKQSEAIDDVLDLWIRSGARERQLPRCESALRELGIFVKLEITYKDSSPDKFQGIQIPSTMYSSTRNIRVRWLKK
jgi:hypothetical protein